MKHVLGDVLRRKLWESPQDVCLTKDTNRLKTGIHLVKPPNLAALWPNRRALLLLNKIGFFNVPL